MEIAYEINATVITDLQVQEWLVKAVLVQAQGSTPCTLQILGVINLRLTGSKLLDLILVYGAQRP